ncbi:MAG: methylmalonyl-CoA mutase family protein, partial [Acidimicrobiales bacterium]
MSPNAGSPEPESKRFTDSGIEIRPVYGPGDIEGWDPDQSLGAPGHYPFTRGIRADMYRG